MKYLRNSDHTSDKFRIYHVGEESDKTLGGFGSHLAMTTRFFPQINRIDYEPLGPDLSKSGDYREYKEGEQMELFHHRITPAVHEVSYVSGTERGRTHFPLLLSIVNNDSLRRHGIPLSPPTDLSKHSLKFTKNLQNRGLLDQSIDIPNEPTNDMKFEKYPGYANLDLYTEIPESEIKEGRASLRKMLRGTRNLSEQFDVVTHPEPQHTQLELDI